MEFLSRHEEHQHNTSTRKRKYSADDNSDMQKNKKPSSDDVPGALGMPISNKYRTQTQSPFFTKLCYDVRHIIYEYVDIGPHSSTNGKNYLGLILSCKQANFEAAEEFGRKLQVELDNNSALSGEPGYAVPFSDGFSRELRLLQRYSETIIRFHQQKPSFAKDVYRYQAVYLRISIWLAIVDPHASALPPFKLTDPAVKTLGLWHGRNWVDALWEFYL
jgi:hypothetical protein